MRIHLLSDIHNEFEVFCPPSLDADVIVLAGDIHTKRRAIDWIEAEFAQKIVLYVLGNHEFYGEALPREVDKLKEKARGKTIHVLENDSFQMGDIEFFGTTFWTDFLLFGDKETAVFEAEQQMTDYRRIRVSPRFSRLRARDTASLHSKSKEWLRNAVKNSRCPKKVIITHHAPSSLSLLHGTLSEILESAYASNEDQLIQELGADLWVHGHIHAACDYMIGRTRVVSNPKGYPCEPTPGFKEDLIIEL